MYFNEGKKMNDGVMCIKPRKNCYGSTDYKFICPCCGTKSFVSMATVNSFEKYWGEKVKLIYFSCIKCNVANEYDISVVKEWYGIFDGKTEINDLFYCGDDVKESIKLIKEIKEIYPESKMYKEYDYIHGYRVIFDSNLKINQKEYFKNIIKLGYLDISIKMVLIMKGVGVGLVNNFEVNNFKEAIKELDL